MKIRLPDKIEILPARSLIPYANNARMHTKTQIAQIAAVIKEYGWTTPILIDPDNGVIAGHGRLEAAFVLDMEDVPCIRIAGLSDAQRRALVVADNRLGQGSTWDEEMLAAELSRLAEDGIDALSLGFSQDEVVKLLQGNETMNTEGEDDIPALPEDPISRPGDVWLLGRHRIICGDSTDPLVVNKLLNGAEPHLMVTDPPYGVNYEPEWRAEAGYNKNKSKMGKVLNDDRSDWTESWTLFTGDVAYVWCASLFSDIVIQSLESCGLERRSNIIWAKDNFVFGRGHYHWKHESCWYAVREGKTGHWQGDHSQTTVWNINSRDDSGHGHSTQKPVEAMRKPIINNSEIGDGVYEPFSGSGTTIIACEETKRTCYAIELNPAYVDLAVKRWQVFTGESATLESSGETFDTLNGQEVT